MLRFGFDIGIASVGWAVIDDYSVLEAGSNIFEAADANNNMERRGFRQHKRLLRRKRTRLQDFDKFWGNMVGKFPKSPCNIQLELRNKGLVEKLSEEELYFVLRNMLTHRGISYLDDALDEDGTGKGSNYARGIQRNREELQGKFPCQIQHERLEKYGRYQKSLEEIGEQLQRIFLALNEEIFASVGNLEFRYEEKDLFSMIQSTEIDRKRVLETVQVD